MRGDPASLPRHIGVAAVSPVGASLFYKRLFAHIAHTLPASQQPRITFHNEPLTEYIRAAEQLNWPAVGGLLAKSARILHHAGAEVCVTPDNAVQFSLHLAETDSPIPWIAMTDTATTVIERDNRSTVGLLGTKWVTGGSVYQTALGMKGIKAVAPAESDSDILHAIILGELVFGEVSSASQAKIDEIINRLLDRGVDSILLCCSEGQLATTAERCPVPIYDSVDILAEHVVNWTLSANITS